MDTTPEGSQMSCQPRGLKDEMPLVPVISPAGLLSAASCVNYVMVMNCCSQSSCNPRKCLEMRKRMEAHKKDHHNKTSAIFTNNKAGQSSFSSLDVMKLDHRTTAVNETDGKVNLEDKAEIPLKNSETQNILAPKAEMPLKNAETQNTLAPKTEIPLKNSETQNILVPRRNFYRENLQDVVLKWFLDIPVLFDVDNTTKLNRLKTVHDLANTIANLSSEVDDVNYNEKVCREIDDCLEKLSMWCPDVKTEKHKFHRNLCRSLHERVQKVNNKWLNSKHGFQRLENNQTGHLQQQGSTSYIFTFSNESLSAVENEIRDWVETEFQLTSDTQVNIDKEAITDVFINRLMPFFKSKTVENNCLTLEIVHALDEMSTSLNLIKDSHSLAIKLANRVINVNKKNNQIIMIQARKLYGNRSEDNKLSKNISRIPSDESEDTIIQITDIWLDGTDSVTKVNESTVAEDIPDEESTLHNTVVTYVSQPLNKDSSFNLAKQYLSDSLIVLTSENELLGPFDKNAPLTSTPHMTGAPKKDIPKLNPEERAYLDKIVEVLRTWLDTVDMTFETTEEQFFKESIANDMAGDIKDLAKQIQMGQIQDRITMDQYEGLLNYVILRAIVKYGLLNPPVTFTTPQVADLREKIKDLGMQIDLTVPQHGDRQKWANFKFRTDNPLRPDQMPQRYQPTALDILEDNISIWMNEQPSEIYKDQDRQHRNEQLREVATKVQKKIESKKEDDVKKELAKWLKKILVSKAKNDADNMAAELKDRIIKLPTDESLDRRMQKTNRARLGDDSDVASQQYSVKESPDEQLKEFIEKFMEHNYDIEDSLVKSALGNILLQELLKLSPALKTEGSNISTHKEFNPDRFRMELEYIKEISDWLKNIPFYPLIGSGNDRVEFVNGLAKNIAEIEEERFRDPGKMEYDKILYSEIYEYMMQLPLRSQDTPNIATCINQLVQRIIRHRPTSFTPITNQNPPKPLRNEQDFAQFIEEFVNIRAKDIGDDKLKLEAYLSRLLKEIQSMINEKADSDPLTRSEMYNRLVDVPVPGRESVKRFSVGLGYVEEIAEWLHNFPLIPLMSQEENLTRIRMISELAEKMAEYDLKKIYNPEDNQAEIELNEYVTNWIDKLNLDTSKEIVVPILLSQLKRRMENVKTRSEQKRKPQPEVEKDDRANNAGKRSSDMSCKGCCSSNKKKCKKSKAITNEDPGDLIVEAIEGWCEKLPIVEENEEATKAEKEKIATDIFQKVGLLNSDPNTANNDMLYRDMLGDEIETELKKISENHPDLSDKKDILKNSLLDAIMDTKEVIKDISAGENYKQALEHTIDSSLPNPVHVSSQHDPGFELYKNRMAMLWLLENYDYAIDFTSLKYKKKLNEDIDNCASEAQKRNVLPLENYEIFNEAFSAMYKQNPPHETSIIEEVESVKMRCEIDAWFKDLPLQKASGYQELLEREQIQALLSKRLFDVERSKVPDAEEKMRKEITKWLNKLPLLPGEDKNINQYVDKLICNLKATAEVRKCKRKTDKNRDSVIKEFVKDANNDQLKEETSATHLQAPKATRKENTSQIAGPSRVGSKPHCADPTILRKKAGDLISNAIETWCNQLPLIAQGPEDQGIIDAIKDETVLKMYQLLSDLHTDPNILNSEGLYEHHLNLEIERFLSELPAYSEAQQMRNARRARIINELKAVRPLIQDEFEREGYKQDLKHAMTSFFEETTKPNKIVVNDNAKQAIIDNFIELSCHRGEFEEQQLCKSKIDDAVAEVIAKNKESIDVDPLITRNQLICEMTKVRPPNESALIDEVQEIRMKEEIAELFKDIKISKGDEEKATYKEQIKLLLAKKLIDIERNGHNTSNDEKMKAEITKAFKKLGAKINPEKIASFVQNLKENINARRAAPPKKDDKCVCPNKSDSRQQNRNLPLGPSLVTRSPRNSVQRHASFQDRSYLPEPPHIPQASLFQPQQPIQPPVFYPQSPHSTSRFQRPITPTRRPSMGPIIHIPRSVSPVSRLAPPPPMAVPPEPMPPPYRPSPSYAPTPHAPITSCSQHAPMPRPGPLSHVQSPNTSRSYNQHISRPDFGMAGHQAAYRQPEILPSPIVDERNIYLNVPELPEERTGTRSTARLPDSPQVRGDPSCSCQQSWSGHPDVERDLFGDCKCKRDKKKNNCQGVCKADEPEYCDECENDHDCDFDMPMLPYSPMYPYLLPRFMFFKE